MRLLLPQTLERDLVLGLLARAARLVHFAQLGGRRVLGHFDFAQFDGEAAGVEPPVGPERFIEVF